MIIPLRIRVISKNRPDEPHRADPNSVSDLRVDRNLEDDNEFDRLQPSGFIKPFTSQYIETSHGHEWDGRLESIFPR